MQGKWIPSTTSLPQAGEQIEFLLDDRSQPIHGTFANGIFHSRWANYDASRVSAWHLSDGVSSPRKIDGQNAIDANVFVTTLKRFTWL